MEPFNAGWLSLLPPAAAIVAALISREVISALLVGILTGSGYLHKLYGGAASSSAVWMLFFPMMVATLEFKILIFTSLLGAVVYLVSLSGGSKAYGEWAGRRMKTKRKSLLRLAGLAVLCLLTTTSAAYLSAL